MKNQLELERLCLVHQEDTRQASLQNRDGYILSAGTVYLAPLHPVIFYPDPPVHLDPVTANSSKLVTPEGYFYIVRMHECFLGDEIHYHVEIQ